MDNQHYEMPKWSVFIKEEFDEGNCAYFELKWATINLYEFESCLEEDYCSLKKADAETNEKLGGEQWYAMYGGFCLDGWETGSRTLEFSSKEIEDQYKKIENEYEELDPDEIFDEMGIDAVNTTLYFKFKRDDPNFQFDITKDFEKYFEENAK